MFRLADFINEYIPPDPFPFEESEPVEVMKIPCDSEVELETEKDHVVSAPGDCWKNLLGARQHDILRKADELVENYSPTMVELGLVMIEARRKMRELANDPKLKAWQEAKLNAVYKCWWQSDGDFHIEDCKIAPRESTRAALLADGYITSVRLLAILCGSKWPKALVGKQSPCPAEKAMASVASPEIRVAVERSLQVPISEMIEQATKICPYRIPQKNQHYMEELALPWLQAGKEHPHPIHAAIRRHILLEELPKFIKTDTTFVSMKEEHFNMVRDEVHKENPHLKLVLVNPVLDLKDIGRYAGSASIPFEVFKLPPISTPAVHVDEAWHYLNPAFMDGLARKNPEVVYLTATSIFPLLSLTLEQSPDPDLYGFTVHRPKGREPMLTYWMEGNTREKYTQPFDPTMILCKRVESTDGKIVWNGGSVMKLLNTRLHVFTRFHVSVPNFEIEIENKYIKLPKVFRNQLDLPMMRLDHFVKIADYAMVMPQDKDSNYWGKWRLFLDDQGIHLPWGYKQHMIDVIVKCKQLSYSPKLKDRNITGFWHNCYYETFGKLQKFYEKKLVVPWVKRRADMISQDSNVMTWPTLAVVVKPWDDGPLYSIAWKLDGEDGRGFWGKMTMWLKSWGYKGLTPQQVLTDVGDHIRFPFSANTWLQQQKLGITAIQDSQARAFRQVFQGSTETPKPRVNHFTAPETLLLKRKPDPRDDVVVKEDDESTHTSEGSAYQEPESLPELAATYEPLRFMQYQHCDDCPPYHEYVMGGGKPAVVHYHRWCEQFHPAPETSVVERRLNIAMIKQATRARKEGTTHLPIIVEEEEVPTMPAAPLAPQVKSPELGDVNPKQPVAAAVENEVKPVAPNSRPDPLINGKRAEAEAVRPYTAGIERSIKKTESTWNEREKEWSKRLKLLSRERTISVNASGGLLWDALYPMTMGARLNSIPYRDVATYAGPKYPKNDCLLVALGAISGKEPWEVLNFMQRGYKRSALQDQDTLEEALIWPFACHLGVTIVVRDGRHERYYGVKSSRLIGVVELKDAHYEPVEGLRFPLRIQSPRKPFAFRSNPVMQQLIAWPATRPVSWVPEKERADKLIRALIAGEVGLIGQPINQSALLGWSSTIDIGYKGPPKDLMVVMGDPGCRKSSKPQKHMRENRVFGMWGVVAPTNQIAQDYRDNLDATTPDKKGKKMPGDMVLTWETALAKYAAAELIITDENKYPPGYVAMFHILNPSSKAHLFLGDMWQASWHWPKPTTLNDEISELEYYSKYAKGYIVGTYRYAGLSAAFFRTPSYSKREGGWAFTRAVPTVWTALKQYFPWENDATLLDMWERRQEYTAAHFQAEFAEEIRGSEARSYSGSIGVTTPLAIIHIDDSVMRGSDPRLIYTAMTRSWNILFVIGWVHNRTSEYLEAIHPVFSKLAYYRQNYTLRERLVFNPQYSVSIRECYKPFPPEWTIWMAGPFERCTNFELIKQWWPRESWENFIDPDAKRGGARLSRSEPAYADEPTFQPFIDETPEFEPEDPVPEDVHPPTVPVDTSIPQADRVGFEEFHNAQVQERFMADKFVHGTLPINSLTLRESDLMPQGSWLSLLRRHQAETNVKGVRMPGRCWRVLPRQMKTRGIPIPPFFNGRPINVLMIMLLGCWQKSNGLGSQLRSSIGQITTSRRHLEMHAGKHLGIT
jgi:hypothetical protein